MLIALLFFTCSCLLGLMLLHLAKINLGRASLFAATTIGAVSISLLFYFLGLIGLFKQPVLLVFLLFIFLFGLWFERKTLFNDLKSLSQTFLKLDIMVKLITISLAVLIIWLFGRALIIGENGQVIAGDRLVWTDWPLHIAMASSFAWGDNFPAQNPTFSGEPLVYPFMSNFFSGILLKLGAGLVASFAVPGIILILCFFGLFAAVIFKLFSELKDDARVNIAILALFLTLFWGGIGFVYWLNEAFTTSGKTLEILSYPAREYSFYSEKNLWFFTFLYSEILPQRAFLFGLPIFCLVIYLVLLGLEKKQIRPFILAGLLSGISPFFHTHTFISLTFLTISIGAISFLAYLFKKIRLESWLLKSGLGFAFTFGLLILVQIPILNIYPRQFPVVLGWMAGKENLLWFWFKNTGLFIPLFLIGLWLSRKNLKLLILGAASWILFILPNIWSFAPWGYDNLKILTFWYLIGSIFAAVALYKIWQKGILFKIISILLFLSLTTTGLLEVRRIFATPKTSIGLWSSEDQQLAQFIIENTPAKSTFLTAAIHDHPAASLAGRKIVIGYPGNSWSWGIPGWDTRERDVRQMFQGGEITASLWKKYSIDYIIVSDRERWFEKRLDEGFIAQNTTFVGQIEDAKIYRVIKSKIKY